MCQHAAQHLRREDVIDARVRQTGQSRVERGGDSLVEEAEEMVEERGFFVNEDEEYEEDEYIPKDVTMKYFSMDSDSD